METKINESLMHIFDEQVQLTGIVEYGLSWAGLTEGKLRIPPEGARFDISFEGEIKGGHLRGRIRGTDFLEVRADGKFILNIQATIITDDGETIALKESGVLLPKAGSSTADIYLTMNFSVHSEKYEWLNKANVWGLATVNMQEGLVSVRAYSHPVQSFQFN